MNTLDLARSDHETALLENADARDRIMAEITEAARGGVDRLPLECRDWPEFMRSQQALMHAVAALVAALRAERAPRIIVN